MVGNTIIGNNDESINIISQQTGVQLSDKSGRISGSGYIKPGPICAIDGNDDGLGIGRRIIGTYVNFNFSIGEVYSHERIISPRRDIGGNPV